MDGQKGPPPPVTAPGPGVKHRAQIFAYIGASGSGKSRSMRAEVQRANPRRLVIWDPMNEYAEIAPQFPTLSALFASLAGGKGRGRYVPRGGMGEWAPQFAAFCSASYAMEGGTVMVEEISNVTQPSYAPPNWSRLCSSGRHRGLTVMAATQRPSMVDKTFLGNCSKVRCFRLNWRTDLMVMANVLGCKVADLTGMKPGEWVEKDMLTGEIRFGSLP